MIVYEAPHHLLKTLRELLETLGNRRLTLCRELTKKHETAWQTTIEDAITRYEQEDPKGECVLVIEGRSQKEIEDEAKAAFEEISIEEHMKRYEDQGIARKEAMKLVAKDRGVTKRDIYQYLLGKESYNDFDQAIAQSCGFCLQGGVQVFSAEGLERRFESGVQQIVISDSVASASLLNQLSMQHENLLFTQSFHLASTSYASLFCSIRRFEMLNTSSSDAVVSCSALLKSMTRYLGMLFSESQQNRIRLPGGRLWKILICFGNGN